ncbi:MAG: hypothetical protein ACJZ10_00590 [Candidatus Neomarinimicrobiota bacterium]
MELNSALNVGDIDMGSKDIEVISESSLNIVSITTPASDEVSDGEV